MHNSIAQRKHYKQLPVFTDESLKKYTFDSKD